MYISLNSRASVPISNVLVVFGVTREAETTRSWAGPILVIAPPFSAVPSCVCPDVPKAVAIASNSPSKSEALIILQSAILFVVSVLD